jgi:hypothetical protein
MRCAGACGGCAGGVRGRAGCVCVGGGGGDTCVRLLGHSFRPPFNNTLYLATSEQVEFVCISSVCVCVCVWCDFFERATQRIFSGIKAYVSVNELILVYVHLMNSRTCPHDHIVT